jgi:hypothetical protein
MTPRLPLHVPQRMAEHESAQLKARLFDVDQDLERCDAELAGLRRRLAQTLADAGSSVREGGGVMPGALMLWRAQARSLQLAQVTLEQQRELLVEQRREIQEALAAGLVTMKTIDAYHRQLVELAARLTAKRQQSALDELMAARRGWQEPQA